ncbi:hypothetical protein N7508_002489 [Penicillium antarcticum]|uniref:uncharacterized protein n=1 Tax=Penicillium antarcticum TaxID=416450 RepID=UPI002389E444|nr:uncharacterized protein N7508_002489 [Penicillium antarcticum]KAJ5317981.1 hypothetical protein N7508_002489 [Penicillium antarcticum]
MDAKRQAPWSDVRVINVDSERSGAISERLVRIVAAQALHVDQQAKARSQQSPDEDEKKIDLIEERLGNIERSLQELVRNTSQAQNLAAPQQRESCYTPSPQNSTPRNSGKAKIPLYKTNPTIEQHDTSSGFEGSSSLTAHGAYASAFLETAVSKSSPQVLSSPKINAALSSLKKIVRIQNQRREVDLQGDQGPAKKARLGVRCDIRELEMPPLQLVLGMLRQIKENPPACFGGYVPFLRVDYFTEKCREVYFCTDEFSDAAFVISNFGIYSIFYEFGCTDADPNAREEYLSYIEMCRNNLETALANLNILMPATQESIKALAVGAMHALEIAKPSVGWTLASTAMNLCQTLGYHRLSSMEHDSPSIQREKQNLFWSVYTILNMMTLRLGRACSIQNYDISLPAPSLNPDIPSPWGGVCVWWTRSAIIQSNVYRLLYSPEALQQPESDRVAHAYRLAAEMQETVMEPFERFMSSGLKIADIDIIYLQTDKISRLSILTLIYRAIPASEGSGPATTFIPECIKTAREALEVHRQCVAALSETFEFMKISYMHWAVLMSPFVPFIVIFCNVITTSNQADLTQLEEFIASLRPLCSYSQSIDRLHTLCSVLGTVARLYFEANTRQINEDSSLAEVGQEFDVYLSALGLAPANAMSGTGVGTGNVQAGIPNTQGYLQADIPSVHVSSAEVPQQSQQGPPSGFPCQNQIQGQTQGQGNESASAEMAQAAQLGNWFWGNQYMMGLLEEDLSQFTPSWS